MKQGYAHFVYQFIYQNFSAHYPVPSQNGLFKPKLGRNFRQEHWEGILADPEMNFPKKPSRVASKQKNWRPQRDSNPRRRRERPVSWARLDDGDFQFYKRKRNEPRRDRTFDHLIKSQVLYQLS